MCELRKTGSLWERTLLLWLLRCKHLSLCYGSILLTVSLNVKVYNFKNLLHTGTAPTTDSHVRTDRTAQLWVFIRTLTDVQEHARLLAETR